MKRYFLLLCLISFLAFSACKKAFYSSRHTFDNKQWAQKNSIVFNPEIKESQKSYQIVVDLRHTSHYECKNIIFSMAITSPSGKRTQELFDMPLAAEDGLWTGEWLGDIVDHTFILKRNYTFAETGKYKIVFAHQMRDREKLNFMIEFGCTLKEAK